ncbi:MAG: hypothetical protein J6T59_07320 [Bacteroidales bacterium]|nr:hypothetical protein [Bacteroidales bacterium]
MSQRITFLAILLTALVLGGCKKSPAPIVITPDVNKNHLQRNHIYGKVKEIESRTFYFHEDSLTIQDSARALELTQRPCDRYFLHNYNPDGFLSSFVNVGMDGDTLIYRCYFYNDRGQISEWTEKGGPSDPITKGVYGYDRNHFLESEKVFHGDTLVLSFAYKTDGIGNIISSTQDNLQFVTVTNYHYNEHGLVDKIEEHEPDGKIFKSATIEYDNYGDEVNRCVYKAGKQLIEYTYNEYSQKGRNIKTIYEDRLHQIKEVNYYAKYDKENNWLVEYSVLNDKLVSIRKRNIKYY